MIEFFLQIFYGLVLALLGLHLMMSCVTLCSFVYFEIVQPKRIPQWEIDEVAESIITGFSDPEREVYMRHLGAWYRCEIGGHTYWKRVRRAVQEQLAGTRTGADRL
jgi:hypothetical protein